MGQKKPWILRPVAWICTIIMMLLLQLVAELICLLGEYIIYRLSGMSTLSIVISAMTFGGFFLSGFFYSIIYLTTLFVELSNKIYSSHHAFRFYFVGIYEIVGCTILIFAETMGSVTGGSMFWYYARYVWLILASISIMLGGRAEASKVPAKITHELVAKATSEAPIVIPSRFPPQDEAASYDRLLKILQIGAGANDIDSAISMFANFYLRKGIKIPSELFMNVGHLPVQEKCEKLLRILETGIGVTGIDTVTRRFIEFYKSKGIAFPDDIL